VGGSEALLPAEDRVEGVKRRFSLRALEVIAVGIAKNRKALQASADSEGFIRQKIAQFWTDPIAAELSSAGMRGTTRIQRSIPLGEQWFNPDVEDD
jgi:hypothetical protein